MRPECSEFQKRIPKNLLGDLNADQRQALEAHLATCSLCRSEREYYIRILHQMKSLKDEPVPRHFFVYPKEPVSNFWELFFQMKPRWRAATVAFAGLFLLIGVAGISRLQIRSDAAGWALSFGHSDIDVGSLKKDILRTANENDHKAKAAWLQEVRAEIERSQAELARQAQNERTSALAHLDSLLTGRINLAEGRLRGYSQNLALNLFGTVAQQRAKDLQVINLRFDSIEENNAIETRQTDAILDTLLQAAELRLR
jgi:hypothetical protein